MATIRTVGTIVALAKNFFTVISLGSIAMRSANAEPKGAP
jgi:hypothetical protein